MRFRLPAFAQMGRLRRCGFFRNTRHVFAIEYRLFPASGRINVGRLERREPDIL